MIAEPIIVSVVWLILSLLFLGLGAVCRSLFQRHVPERSDLFLDWWMGWALCVVFLLAWHLLLPITFWTYVPLGIASAAGTSMAWKGWMGALRVGDHGWGRIAGLLLLAWVAVASQTLGPERQYDTALYHLQSVRWAQAYAVVPGLANVHARFAMNSSFFLFAALVEQIDIAGRTLRMAAGILFLPLIVKGLVTAHDALVRGRRIGLSGLFDVLMLPVIVWESRQFASGLSPDGAVFVLTVVLSAELLQLLRRQIDGWEQGRTEVSLEFRVFAIATLAVVGVTVKLSFVFFAVACVGVTLWSLLRVIRIRVNDTGTSSTVQVARIVVATTVVTALWMLHGVIISGYIAYPSPVGSFSMEWRIPEAIVRSDAAWIRAWARSPKVRPGEIGGYSRWFPGWLALVARDRDVIGVVAVLLLATGLRFRRRPATANPAWPVPRIWMFLCPSLISVAAWFATAPAIRFIIGPLWVIGISTLAWVLAPRYSLAPNGSRHSRPGLVLLFSMLVAALGVAWHESVTAQPSFAIKRVTTHSGLEVYMPVSGDRCGDAPLPCANQQPDDRLELRRPGSMEGGFRLAR